MRRTRRQGGLYRFLIIVRRVANGAIAVFSASHAATPERFAEATPILASLTSGAQDWAWIVIFLCLVGTWGCSWGLKALGNPVLLAGVDELLDSFRDGVFPDSEEDHAHHRVTLFKHRRFLLRGFDFKNGGWPLSGWLVPIARSGHTTQKTNVRFLASERDDKAHGIAGRAWAVRIGTAVATGLPDLKNENVTPEDFAEYAGRTYVPNDWSRRRQPRARSLMAFTIESNRGAPWGVLVIDSRNPELDQERAKLEFRNHGKVLGRLVEAM